MRCRYCDCEYEFRDKEESKYREEGICIVCEGVVEDTLRDFRERDEYNAGLLQAELPPVVRED